MGAFATRIGVSEVRFPWYCPNVNANNNQIWLGLVDTIDQLTIYQLNVNPGFYSGDLLAEALNSIIIGQAVYGTYQAISGPNVPINLSFIPVFSFNDSTGQMTFTPNATLGAFLYYFNPVSTVFNPLQYYNSPSLCLLMNFDVVQVSGQLDSFTPLTANPTDMRYTQYIDIVSDKLAQYAKSRDGSSDNNFNRSLICRLYIADDNGAQPASFTIYRQFQNPKMIEWNKESAIDWVDIAVYDQFGNLLPLPTFTLPGGAPAQVGVYPDFEITLLASQD